MDLYFIRHGIAEDGIGKSDFDRRLTPEGRYALRRQVIGLQRRGFSPDMMFTSPYARALETAQILSRTLGLKHEVWAALGCGCTIDDVSEMITIYDAPSSVAIVGHQPDLSEMVHHLTGKWVDVAKGAVIHLKINRLGLLGGTFMEMLEPEVQMAY
ncbi:MAG: phosphohistidine phosphatase SixA [Bacteroidetes Order II. Incertae sedis bacterium]|nr:phosphohistidine phosphatase SixA [Bacteroidetes Order II. bacterium]